MENLRLVYRKELSLAKAHVQAQKKPNNGNALTKEKRNKMLELNIDCVHCGTLLSGNNYNTEHILDLSLGGENTVDNKMLMCKICNSARAELKVSLLGNQPTMAKWDLVEAYVLWSFITVDHGHASGANIPQVHQEFLRLASGGRERERNGTRWFARASNTSLSVSSGGNKAGRPVAPREARPRGRRQGWLGFSLREWLRGSAQDRRRQQSITPSSAPLLGPQPASDETKTIIDSELEQNGVSTAALRAMVLAQIPPSGEIKQAQLGNQVKHSDPQQRSLRELFVNLGFAKSKSMNALLENLLIGKAKFRDEGTVRYWSKPSSSQPPLEDRKQTVKGLFHPHLSSEDFVPMSTLLGRVRYADAEKRSTKTLTTLAGYPKSWGLLKILLPSVTNPATTPSASRGGAAAWLEEIELQRLVRARVLTCRVRRFSSPAALLTTIACAALCRYWTASARCSHRQPKPLRMPAELEQRECAAVAVSAATAAMCHLRDTVEAVGARRVADMAVDAASGTTTRRFVAPNVVSQRRVAASSWW